jgi:hypothetical protein
MKNSQTLGAKQGEFLFGEFKKDENHTYYEDQVDENQRHSSGSINSLEKNVLAKETEPNDPEKVDTSKRETHSFMQEDIRNYTDNEKKFMVILSNTSLVYDYTLSDEYMLSLLKHNNMSDYIEEYINLIDQNNLNYRHWIVELGDSSLKRFLINKEKRIFEFPPSENDNIMVIRDGECTSRLRLNKKQMK